MQVMAAMCSACIKGKGFGFMMMQPPLDTAYPMNNDNNLEMIEPLVQELQHFLCFLVCLQSKSRKRTYRAKIVNWIAQDCMTGPLNHIAVS
jgi:hypothetical protein